MTNNVLGLIGLSARARKISFGSDSVEEEIRKRKVKLLIIAKDSSERTKEKFEKLSKEYKIPTIIDGNIEELSKAIGKNNKAILGIKDGKMAEGIQKKYNGGDLVG